MEFTFKQLLELIEKIFEIKRSALENYFGINKSTISRLYSGKTHSSRLGNNEIYKHIFDPTNPKSLACEKNPNTPPKNIEHSLLDTIKQTIESEHWTDSTKEINSNEYKDYIIGLINLARTNSYKSPKKEKKNISEGNFPNNSISSSPSEDTSLKSSPATDGVASISIPLQYRKCLYCEYFDIAKTIHKYDTCTLGTCTVSAKQVTSASSACNNFLKNTGKITRDMLVGFSNKFGL